MPIGSVGSGGLGSPTKHIAIRCADQRKDTHETHFKAVAWIVGGRRLLYNDTTSGSPATETSQHRHADGGRRRLERFRRLFGRRQGARPSDAEHRSPCQGRRAVHELVRPGELHGGPRLVHHRAHPDPLGAVGRRRSRRRECLRKETPTIAEFFKKNGYTTYFSGKWHLGDKPEFYPIEHGFDEMKEFAAYYPGVYSYDDTSPTGSIRGSRSTMQRSGRITRTIVNLYEWEGAAGQPARKVARITYDYLADFDVRQADSAIAYIKEHANGDKPVLHGRQLHEDAQPDQPRAGLQGQVAARQLLRLDAGTRRQHRPRHGRDPRRGAGHHRHLHLRQRRLAGRLARRRRDAVPRREGIAHSKAAGAFPASCGRRATFRPAQVSTR